jgi:hypothetical protein
MYIRTLILALCAASLGTVTPAPAATLIQLTVDQMTQSATAIVRATVTGSTTSRTGSTIYTHYTLQVSDTLKGVAPSEVDLPGGVAGGYRQSFPGVPQLQAGSEYVLFLWKSPSTGIMHIVGLSQGLFTVSVPSDGTAQVARARIGETMLNSTGNVVQDHAIQMTLSALKLQVSQNLPPTAPPQ